MERGLLVELSPNEETALHRVTVVGQFEIHGP
jgi:hypothetical protein